MDVELIYLVVFIAAVIFLLIFIGWCINKIFQGSRLEEDLTTQQREFYGVLCQVCAGRAIVICNIRLTQLSCFKTKYAKWSGNYRALNAQQFDFVICRSTDYQPIAEVEFESGSGYCIEKISLNDKIITMCNESKVSVNRLSLSSVNDLARVEALLFPELPARFQLLDSGLQLPVKELECPIGPLES